MTAPLAPTLLRVIDGLVPELVAFRRDLHAHPELSFQEHRTTARLVVEALKASGRTDLV